MIEKSNEEYFAAVHENHRLLGFYLEGILGNMCARNEIKIDHVTSRSKAIGSAAKKMSTKNYASHRDVRDLCGVRIVVRHLSDIARVRELIASEFIVEDEEDRKPIQADVFGYSGYHMTVKLSPQRASLIENEAFENLRAEVQIRTILQHAWASISHSLDYKNEAAAPQNEKRALHQIAALLESADEQFDRYKDSIEALGGEADATEVDDETETFSAGSLRRVASFDWHGLSGLAEAHGWRNFSRLRGKLGNKREKEAFERLAEAVQLLGYVALSELENELKVIDAPVLRKIADEGQARSYIPFAIGPDVFGLLLCAKNHRNALAVYDHLSEVYRRELLDASIASGERTGLDR